MGDFIRCTSAEGDFSIQPGNGALMGFKAQYGLKFPNEFESIVIESATAQTIVLVIGTGELFDNRLAGTIDLTGALSMIQSAAAVTDYGKKTIGMAAAIIKATNANRQSILIQNNSANSLYVGTDNLVTAANGIHIAAGGSLELKTQADVYGYASAAGTDVRYIDEAHS